MSGINWNSIPQSQQAQFLEAAGLDRLPEAAALSDAQLKLLTGILGENTGLAGAAAGADKVSNPRLPAAQPMEWSDVLALVASLRAKSSENQTAFTIENLQHAREQIMTTNAENLQKIADALKKLDEFISRRFSPLTWLAMLAGLGVSVGATVMTGGAAAPLFFATLSGIGAMKLHENMLLEPIKDFLGGNPELVAAIFGVVKAASASLAALNPLAVAAMVLVAGVTAYLVIASDDGIEGAARDFGQGVENILDGIKKFLTTLAEKIISKPLAGDDSDGEFALWLAKLQAKMAKEDEELEETIAGLQQKMAGIFNGVDELAGARQKVSFHIGM